jgi:hypothetical protein
LRSLPFDRLWALSFSKRQAKRVETVLLCGHYFLDAL